jgi:anti-sigma-K factor RskA
LNPQEYISSGILETYVLGLATEEEAKQVQEMMAAWPEVRIEVEAIEASLMEHAALQVNEPPAELRDRIITEATGISPRIVNMNTVEHRTWSFYKYAAAASIGLFIISAAMNFYLFRNLKDAQTEIAALNQEKEQIAAGFQAEKASYQNQLAAISSPESKTIVLKGTATSPSSQATVFWNKESHIVYIKINDLPAPPQGKQYQLWALANGKPIDAGVFDMNDTSGMQKMKEIDDAQAFAVTLEVAGGSPAPTLTAMYLAGNL